jgi:hypothetical protein
VRERQNYEKQTELHVVFSWRGRERAEVCGCQMSEKSTLGGGVGEGGKAAYLFREERRFCEIS